MTIHPFRPMPDPSKFLPSKERPRWPWKSQVGYVPKDEVPVFIGPYHDHDIWLYEKGTKMIAVFGNNRFDWMAYDYFNGPPSMESPFWWNIYQMCTKHMVELSDPSISPNAR